MSRQEPCNACCCTTAAPQRPEGEPQGPKRPKRPTRRLSLAQYSFPYRYENKDSPSTPLTCNPSPDRHKPTADTRQRPCAATNGQQKPDLWLGIPEDDPHGSRRQDAGQHCQGDEEVQRDSPLEEQQQQDGQDQRLHKRHQQNALFPFPDTMSAIVLEMLFYSITFKRVVLLHTR